MREMAHGHSRPPPDAPRVSQASPVRERAELPGARRAETFPVNESAESDDGTTGLRRAATGKPAGEGEKGPEAVG